MELDLMILKRGEAHHGDKALIMFLNVMDVKV
jgi:hypothetical protein